MQHTRRQAVDVGDRKPYALCPTAISPTRQTSRVEHHIPGPQPYAPLAAQSRLNNRSTHTIGLSGNGTLAASTASLTRSTALLTLLRALLTTALAPSVTSPLGVSESESSCRLSVSV